VREKEEKTLKDKRKWVLAAVLAAVMLAAGPGVLAHAAAAAVLEAGTDANTLSEEGNAQGQKEDGPGEKPVPEAAWADDKTGLENQQPDAAETEPVQTQPAGLESSPAQIMPEQENSQMQGDSSVSDSQTDSSVGGGIPLADGSGGAAQKDVAEVTVDGGGTYRVNELKDAFKPQGGAVKITLLEDVQLQYVEYMIEIDNGGTYTLDLNNHIISGETTYTGWSIFLIRNGCLVLQDSGDKDRGCIQSNKYANAVSVEENGSFIFYSGKIDGFSQGVMVWSGKAEITGKSHIRTNGFGLVFVSGEIFISGEAEIYGSNCGVSSARGGEKVSGTITIDGNPYICGGGYGLVVDFYWYMVTPDYHVNISGGTFECETADEGEQRAVYIDTGMNVPVISWLKNYGTDRTPNYTFYNCDDKSPATNIFYNDSAYGKVYVDICYHKDGWSYYSQIPNTTTHLEMCLYCGNSKKADCTYIWKKDGMVYTGTCRCGSEIKVMLSGKGEYLYNGTEHKPEASVELNYVKLNPDEYTITYMDNRNAGTAKAIVSGRNGYQFQCNAEFAVRKSIISPKEGKLDAENGKRKEYRFDLKQLLPELPRGQEFGSSPAVYRLGDVSLPGSYYAGEARVEGSTLILPLNLAGNHTEGIIGTVKITIVSQNFQDMEGIVTVIAGKAGNGDTDSGDTDTNPDGSDNNSGNENPKPNPVFPDTSPSGSGSYSVSAPAPPFLKDRPQKAGWNVIRWEAEKEPEGSILEINMNGTSEMPGRMAETLRERGITAVLEMNRAFSWSIDGKNAADGTLQDADLGIRRIQGAVPKEVLDAVAGGRLCAQLRLEQAGAFGFDGVLVMQTANISWTAAGTGTAGVDSTASGTGAAARYAGMHANLFYYNQAENRLEFADAGKIETDGTVRLVFRKGSRYAVILSEQPMGTRDTGTSPSGSGSTADSGTNPSDSGSTAKNENEPGNSSAAGNENEPDKSAGDAHTVTSVKLSKTVFTYTGKAKKPSVIAINKEGKRISARYYTITYKNNKKAGIAAAAVKFRGTYKSAGTVKLAFTIRPAKPSIQKITGVSGGILVKWKKAAQAGGYQIQYSENADFQGSSTHSVFAESPSVTQKTLGKRKDGTGYYVRIRAYRTARSESRQTKIYSAWSTPVRIRGK